MRDDDEPVPFEYPHREREYTHSEIADLLDAVERLGFTAADRPILENMTFRAIDVLVHRIQ